MASFALSYNSACIFRGIDVYYFLGGTDKTAKNSEFTTALIDTFNQENDHQKECLKMRTNDKIITDLMKAVQPGAAQLEGYQRGRV